MTDEPKPYTKGWLEAEADKARRAAAGAPPRAESEQLEAEEWARRFGQWLGRPDADATVTKTLAALLSAVIAAHGQVVLTREQVLENAPRPIQLRRTKDRVILFLGEPEEEA